MKKINQEKVARMYQDVYTIRRLEEEIIRVYPSDDIKSPVHLSIGQEAVSVGVCHALDKDDVVFGTYRGHALYIAKGGGLKAMVAELYGKITGCAKGKGGSMHLVDLSVGVMGTSAIVATTIPISVGYAYAFKYKNSKSAAVTFFGDGAVDEGAFYESINFAALKKLPVLFVCENNFYAIHSHQSSRHPVKDITGRAGMHGICAQRIPGNDIFKIYDAAVLAIKEIRAGKGPVFLECETYRWKEHVGPADDFYLGYRDVAEVKWWKDNDQLIRLKKMISANQAAQIENDVEKKIEDAFNFARASEFPGYEELYSDLYKEEKSNA